MEHFRSWNELAQWQQRNVVVLGSVQLVLLVATLVDLSRRDPTEINGSKGLWFALAFVNFVGPLAYFLVGRKR